MNRWTRRLLILAVVGAVILILRLTVLRPEPVPVTVYVAQKGLVEDTVVNSRAGTVKSRFRSRMSPGIPGLVSEIPVRKGQRVKQGEVLLRLDATEHEAQVNLAERSLEAARAVAREACLTADQGARDLARAEKLFDQNHLSESELEKTRTAAESASAACAAARQRVKQAEASLDVARATLAKTAIVAPFDGVVLDVTPEVGEWITPSPPGVYIPPVVDLIDPAALYVEAPLDEADVARVAVGLPVRITMDAFRGRSFAGTLTYVSSFVEARREQNRTLVVEAVFTQPDLPANVLPGLSADIEVILDVRQDVLRLPTYALLEGDRVLVVRRRKLVEVAVRTGLANWQYTEIISGLAEGDRVVVSLDRPEVKEGATVRIEDEVQR